MQEIWVWSLGQEDPLEKEVTTHSSILAWEIPWTEEPGRLQSMGSQTVRHDLSTKQQKIILLLHSILGVSKVTYPQTGAETLPSNYPSLHVGKGQVFLKTAAMSYYKTCLVSVVCVLVCVWETETHPVHRGLCQQRVSICIHLYTQFVKCF